MMSDPKPFASLNAGLLARKGAARPAMRRQPLSGLGLTISSSGAGSQDDLGWNDMGYDVDPDIASISPAVDLKPFLSGSVMMGDEAEALVEGEPDHSIAERKDARAQQAELALRLDVETELKAREKARKKLEKTAKSNIKKGKTAPQKDAVAQVATGKLRARDKAAFTLRLDADRHLALRLASAVTNQSSQAIMTRLLDEYLASVPEIGDLAGRVAAVPPAKQRVPR